MAACHHLGKQRVEVLVPRFISVIAVSTSALVGVFGVAVVSATGSSSSPTAHASAANVKVALRAIRTARGAVGGRPYDIERERFRGKRVWEVKLAPATGRPREVLVSANGRNVLHRETTGRSDEARQARKAKIGLAAAIRKASRRANGRLEDAEIDDHRGQIVWAVSFQKRFTETDVYIHINTGAVVGIDRDDD